MSDPEETVRFNVQMPEQLRDDAKRNTDRGELSNDVRNLFRRKAYGLDSTGEPSELERVQAELKEARREVDDLRHRRAQIETKIEAKETRVSRLEERVDSLQEREAELESAVGVLENMLHDGDRMWPTRIKNAVEVDPETAQRLYQELRERNSDLPSAAFEEPGVHSPTSWKDEATNTT